jgi:hypothetical protein
MDFLKDVHGWNNHRPLLWWALQHTKQSAFPILEMGCGDGSTPYLQEYAKKHKKQVISYDYDKEWAAKFGATHVTDWDSIEHNQYSVVLIDHSPGERRHIDIAKLADKAHYIVIHDSEPAATGYMLNKIWHLFPYRRDLMTQGAWATIVSRVKVIPPINIKGFDIR